MRVSVSVGVVVGVTESGCVCVCVCVATVLAFAFITSFRCFSLACDLLLAVDSCVLFVAAAGWDDGALALEERC